LGSGSFFKGLEEINLKKTNLIGIDLEPEEDIKNNKKVIQQDWLKYQIKPDLKTLIIGNPPFGKMNKLSKEFIKHSVSFDNVYTIAFVLPNVYNKHTLQKVVPKKYRLKTIYELPRDSFTIDNEDYHVPCSFFVFEKSIGECLRFNPELYKETNDWEYASKPQNGDFYVLGTAPQNVKELNEVNENNRGYYIKVKDPKKIEKIKDNFRNTTWKGHSSANGGVSWFTKPELVKVYMENN